MLKEVRLSIVGKTVKEFGGLAAVPPELAQRCLQRMAAWAELSKVIVQSEFPAFELCSCFAVFVLKARANPQGLTESWRRRALEKLAMAFKLPTSNSIAEFFDMYPIAQNIYCTEGVSNAAAWSSAVRRCSYRASMAARHPTGALRPVLVRYLAWGISTCSVERDFAKTLKLRGGQCEDQFVSREEDALCLQSDDDPAAHDSIVKAAARTWSSLRLRGCSIEPFVFRPGWQAAAAGRWARGGSLLAHPAICHRCHTDRRPPGWVCS